MMFGTGRCESLMGAVGTHIAYYLPVPSIIKNTRRAFHPALSRFFGKIVLYLFSSFLLISVNGRPLWADVLSNLEPGGTFQFPGSNLSSTLLDKNNDGVVDGIDFDGDGGPELAVLNINRNDAVGIDDNGDHKPNFYIVENKSGDLAIANALDETIEAGDGSTSIKKINIWNHLSFSGAGSYSFTFGDFVNALPTAFVGTLYIDQGLDSLFSGITELKRHFWFPGFRLAGTYNLLTAPVGADIGVSWIGIQMGLLWHIDIHPKHNGYFTFAPLFGVVNLTVQTTRGPNQGLAFNGSTSFGYTYHFGDANISISTVARYVLSEQGTLFQLSGMFGAGYRIQL